MRSIAPEQGTDTTGGWAFDFPAIFLAVIFTALGLVCLPQSIAETSADISEDQTSTAEASPPGDADPAPVAPPNIVVIIADDAALMDFGAYGGEAATPNIDRMAEQGASFTQYRTSPLCSPTRAMLLTGLDNHLTGVATIPEVLPKEQRGQPGYTMALEPGVKTIADRLKTAGYRTLMSGKWHIGEKAGELPNDHGFDRSLALAASGADNWRDQTYIPYYPYAPWFEDGEPADLPEQFYSSELIVDRMIEYMAATNSDQPFFAYLPFQAIHIPVQAPPEFIARYDGVYDQGWHVMRADRHLRAQQLGLISEGAPLAPMPAHARDWDSLSVEDRELYAARMEVNAAMLEAMDFHIGRFIDHLIAIGEYDNTIFVITSDNGPEPSSGDNDLRLATWMSLNGYHIELEDLGGVGSWGFIGPEWANAAASPGALFKFYATEGGIRAPLIIYGPGITPTRIDSPAMVTDITPTLLDMLNFEIPEDDAARRMTGRSLLPVITGETDSVYAHDDVRAIEVSGNSALYKGDYKITRSIAPVGDGKWRLFDMVRDPGETTDISAQEPEIMRELLAAYAVYERDHGVLPMPADYDSAQQIGINMIDKLSAYYRWYLIAFAIIAFAILIGMLRLLIWLVRSAFS
ncbi:MAG: arylsulfatase [Henriciella sp.]